MRSRTISGCVGIGKSSKINEGSVNNTVTLAKSGIKAFFSKPEPQRQSERITVEPSAIDLLIAAPVFLETNVKIVDFENNVYDEDVHAKSQTISEVVDLCDEESSPTVTAMSVNDNTQSSNLIHDSLSVVASPGIHNEMSYQDINIPVISAEHQPSAVVINTVNPLFARMTAAARARTQSQVDLKRKKTKENEKELPQFSTVNATPTIAPVVTALITLSAEQVRESDTSVFGVDPKSSSSVEDANASTEDNYPSLPTDAKNQTIHNDDAIGETFQVQGVNHCKITTLVDANTMTTDVAVDSDPTAAPPFIVPMFASGRPKRQAVLNTLARAATVCTLMDVPIDETRLKRRKIEQNDGTVAGGSDQPSGSNCGGEVIISRRTCKASTKTKSVFFMSKEEKARLKEIQALKEAEEVEKQLQLEEQQRVVRQAEFERRTCEQFKLDLHRKQLERQVMFGTGSNPFFEQYYARTLKAEGDLDGSEMRPTTRLANDRDCFPLVHSVGISVPGISSGPTAGSSYILSQHQLTGEANVKSISTHIYTPLKLFNGRDRCLSDGDHSRLSTRLSVWQSLFAELLSDGSAKKSVDIDGTVIDLSCDDIDHAVPSTKTSLNVSTLLTEVAVPKGSEDFVGSQSQGVTRLKGWLQSWIDRQRQRRTEQQQAQSQSSKSRLKGRKCDRGYESDMSDDGFTQDVVTNAALLYGPEGAGKTSAAHACAKELGLAVIEVNAGQSRRPADLKALSLEAGQTRARPVGAGITPGGYSNDFELTSGGGLLILFDEVDASTEDDPGLHTAIQQLVRQDRCAVLLTCNHPRLVPTPFLDSLSPIIFSIDRPSASDCVNIMLRAIQQLNSTTYATFSTNCVLHTLLKLLVVLSGCDPRLCLNQLHISLLLLMSTKLLTASDASEEQKTVTYEESTVLSADRVVELFCSRSIAAGDAVIAFEADQSLFNCTSISEPYTSDRYDEITMTNFMHSVRPPEVSDVSPRRLVTGGGQVVTITGKHFLQSSCDLAAAATGVANFDSSITGLEALEYSGYLALRVTIDGCDCFNWVVISDTCLTVRLPKCETTDKAGVHVVAVTVIVKSTFALSSEATGLGCSWVQLVNRSGRNSQLVSVKYGTRGKLTGGVKRTLSQSQFQLLQQSQVSLLESSVSTALQQSVKPGARKPLINRLSARQAYYDNEDYDDEVFDESIGEGPPSPGAVVATNITIKKSKTSGALSMDDDSINDHGEEIKRRTQLLSRSSLEQSHFRRRRVIVDDESSDENENEKYSDCNIEAVAAQHHVVTEGAIKFRENMTEVRNEKNLEPACTELKGLSTDLFLAEIPDPIPDQVVMSATGVEASVTCDVTSTRGDEAKLGALPTQPPLPIASPQLSGGYKNTTVAGTTVNRHGWRNCRAPYGQESEFKAEDHVKSDSSRTVPSPGWALTFPSELSTSASDIKVINSVKISKLHELEQIWLSRDSWAAADIIEKYTAQISLREACYDCEGDEWGNGSKDRDNSTVPKCRHVLGDDSSEDVWLLGQSATTIRRHGNALPASASSITIPLSTVLDQSCRLSNTLLNSDPLSHEEYAFIDGISLPRMQHQYRDSLNRLAAQTNLVYTLGHIGALRLPRLVCLELIPMLGRLVQAEQAVDALKAQANIVEIGGAGSGSRRSGRSRRQLEIVIPYSHMRNALGLQSCVQTDEGEKADGEDCSRSVIVVPLLEELLVTGFVGGRYGVRSNIHAMPICSPPSCLHLHLRI